MTDLAAAGLRLRAGGLTARALASWAGTDRLAALPEQLPALLERPVPTAAAPLALFVAGATVPRDRLRALPIDELVAADLIELDDPFVRARVAILPLGPSLMVCDRLDAPDATDLVCWPDDSSHHLASALPAGRRDRWRDLGCGSAFAPLARPELAVAIAGLDLNPRAVAFARLGAALSGVRHLAIAEGDLATPGDRAALVTCNAPMPDVDDLPIWRRAGDGFYARLWPAALAAVAPGGLVVVHAMESALAALAELPGERVVVLYTPPDEEGFGIAWWSPDAADRHLCARRRLAPEHPHLTPADREAALAGDLGP